jgi:hypothetical protein
MWHIAEEAFRHWYRHGHFKCRGEPTRLTHSVTDALSLSLSLTHNSPSRDDVKRFAPSYVFLILEIKCMDMKIKCTLNVVK